MKNYKCLNLSFYWKNFIFFIALIIIVIYCFSCKICKKNYNSSISENIKSDPNRLLGSETELFFDQVVNDLEKQPQIAPMKEDTSLPCDFDGDRDCDTTDLNYFKSTIGSRRGEAGYNPAADVDGDGDIDSVDQQYLFPEISK